MMNSLPWPVSICLAVVEGPAILHCAVCDKVVISPCAFAMLHADKSTMSITSAILPTSSPTLFPSITVEGCFAKLDIDRIVCVT